MTGDHGHVRDEGTVQVSGWSGDRWRSDGASAQSRPDPSQCGPKSRGMGYWQDAEPRARVEKGRPLYGSVSVSLRKAQLDRIDAGCRRAPSHRW